MFKVCKINKAGIPKYIKVKPPPSKLIAKPLLKEINNDSLLEKIQIKALDNIISSNNNNNKNNSNNNNNNIDSYTKLKPPVIGEKSKRKIINLDIQNINNNNNYTTFTKEFKESKSKQNLLYSIYPIKKLIFSEEEKIEIHRIETLLDSNELDKAIEYYHDSLFKEDTDINYRGFSMILYYLLNRADSVTATLEYFKYYTNEHYINWLDSIDFIEFLRDCYQKSPEAVNEIYSFLNTNKLLDIKRTFIFCIFYLQSNLQEKAIEIINNSFSQSSSKSNTHSQAGEGEYRYLNDYWDFNSNGNLLYMNKQVMKRDAKSLKYLKEIQAFDKLFAVSGNHLQFYSTITQLFIPNGIITSKKLVPSLIQFINVCLESNELGLLNQLMEPYQYKNSAPTPFVEETSTKAQICALLYYYCYFNSNSESSSSGIVNVKNYLYNSIISNQIQNPDNYRFKEIFFDTLSLCSLELGDYGEAIYFSDVKRNVLEKYCSEYYNRTIGFKTDIYFPFIAFNEYQSRKEVLEGSNANNEKKINENKNSIKYWKDKNNESIIKFTNPSPLNSRLPTSSSFLYRPLNIQELINETDKLIFNRIEKKQINNPREPDSIHYFKKLLELRDQFPKLSNDKEFIENFKQYLLLINEEIYNNNNNNNSKNNNSNINLNNIVNINNNNNNINIFYKKLPHSELFYSLVSRFKEYYENINMKEELLVFLSKLNPQFSNNVFNINNEWFEYLYGKDNEGLKLMAETLDQNTHKSTEFYNFWLYKLSSSDKPEYIEPLSSFSSSIFNSNEPLTTTQINILNEIKSNNPWCEDSLDLLFIKLKFYPTNNFNEFNDQEYSSNHNEDNNSNNNGNIENNNENNQKKELFKARNKLKVYPVKTPDLVKLFLNLSSKAYPIKQDFSNFQEWNSISLNSTDCIRAFVQSVCTILIEENKINELNIYINSERKVIGSMNFKVILEIISPLSPIGQISFIQNHMRLSNSYAKEFVSYIKKLKEIIPPENRSEFSIIDSIISKERYTPSNEMNEKLQKHKDFIYLFSK
ncbi:hypothetical protein DICPUDRAFT_159259, partial [Dictyostelium purpureum]